MANSDDKSLPDQALEALLYAPIGIAYEVLDRLPTWVARGKSQATITKVLGKMAVQKGQSEFEGVVSDIFGVKLGEEPAAPSNGAPAKAAATAAKKNTPKTAAKKTAAETAPNKTAKVTKTAKVSKAAKAPAKATKASSKPATSSPSKKTTSNKTSKKTSSSKKAASSKKAPSSQKAPSSKKAKKKAKAVKPAKVPGESDLALASYGSMPASQIVKRLDSLSETQLNAIRLYEEANRHRVTVLNRIRQIQRSA